MCSERADDTSRFMQAIAALSAAPEPVSEYGRLISSDRRNAFEAILSEITETVLRRELTFKNENGEHLTLDVAERRILRVVDVCKSLGSARGDVPSQCLAPEHSGETLRLLQRFQNLAQDIFVRIRLPESPAPAGYTGISVRDLRAALEEAVSDTRVPEPLARALEICRMHASVAVTDASGGIVALFGKEDESSALSQVSAQFFELNQKNGDNVVHLWRWSSHPTKIVILAKANGICVSLVTSHAHMTECFNQLRRAVCQCA